MDSRHETVCDHDHDLGRRLGGLEREVRRLRRAVLALLAILLAAVVMAQAPADIEAPEVRTRRLIIEDGGGHRRAILAASAEGSFLGLYDGREKARFGVAVTDQPRLSLYDGSGRPRIGVLMESSSPGRAPAASFALYDRTGKVVWKAPPVPPRRSPR